MKRTIHENSRAAYKKIKKTIKVRKHELKKLILKFPRKTTEWYAKKMNVYPNVISGRFSEWKTSGEVKAVGKVKIGDKRLMDIWEVAA